MNADVLNIVIPMAGYGSRFSAAGYALPKPLLPVRGRPMIEVVVENLRPRMPHRFVFICQRQHLENFGLRSLLGRVAPGAEIIGIDGVTEGAACTVLLAAQFIDSDAPLMIANCDQYVAVNMDVYFDRMSAGGYDGYIMTMKADDPKWSFIALGQDDTVVGVYEKKVVSNEATVGIYNYLRGHDFISCAQEMIAKEDRVNGEYYVAPVYNYLIERGARVGFMNIGADRAGMYGLGVPADLQYFNDLQEWPRK